MSIKKIPSLLLSPTPSVILLIFRTIFIPIVITSHKTYRRMRYKHKPKTTADHTHARTHASITSPNAILFYYQSRSHYKHIDYTAINARKADKKEGNYRPIESSSAVSDPVQGGFNPTSKEETNDKRPQEGAEVRIGGGGRGGREGRVRG